MGVTRKKTDLHLACAFLIFVVGFASKTNAQLLACGGDVVNSGDTLTSAMQQMPCTIVVEGMPYGHFAKTLRESSSASGSYTVDNLSGLLGCRSERHKEAVLFWNTYSGSRAVPLLTLQEASLSIADIIKISLPFNPNVVPDKEKSLSGPLVLDLVNSLNQAQKAQLQEGSLTVDNLSGEQRQRLLKTVSFIYVQQNMQSLEGLSQVLLNVEEARVLRLSAGNASGLAIQYLDNGVNPITYPLLPTPQNANRPPIDQADRKEEGLLEDDNIAQHPRTLGEIVEGLNRREGKQRFAVDEALKERPVLLFGETYSTGRDLMYSLASICGVKVQAEKEDILRLTPLKAEPAKSIEDLPRALQTALPVAFQRALSPVETDNVPDSGGKETSTSIILARRVPKPRNPLLMRAQVDRARALRESVLKRLEHRLAARLEKDQEHKGLLIKELSPEERSLLAVALLSTAAEELDGKFRLEPPPIVRRFDELHISGKTYTDRKTGTEKFRFELLLPDQTGQKLRLQTMIQNVRLPD